MGGQTPPSNPGAGTTFGENGTRKLIQQRGELIVMDTALAVVDFSAEPQFQLVIAKTQRLELRPTAGKKKNYQHGSKGKCRRYVPADWVYYIQSAYPFQ